jgi:FkbM family methyltransferase
MIKDILKRLFNSVGYEIRPLVPLKVKTAQSVSFSQNGEDLIVSNVFKLRNVFNPSYIDIGAHDPYYLSNTAIFYQKGCRGINIEANSNLIENFRLYRPGDINLNIGISDHEGTMDFYVMAHDTLSTFSEQEKDNMVSNHQTLSHVEKVSVSTLSSVIKKYFNGIFPDFLSLDVEGMDLQILQSINFEEFAPKVICVEAAEYSPIGAGKRKTELINFLVSQGYYEYANTNLNAIMVKNEFWFV